MRLLEQSDKLVAHLAKTKHLKTVTFIIACLEATISPILPEVFLAVVLAYRKDVSWKVLSLVSALGSSFGALIMYVLGATLYSTYGESLLSFLHGETIAQKAKELFEQNSFMAQFMASLTPLPDRVFSFLAGAFLISPIIIFVATFFGRLIRVLPIAYLSYEYGDEARAYIKKHTKVVGVAILIMLVVYILYKFLG